MNETNPIIPDEIVVSKIFLFRGQKVMIDRDLAQLYGVEPRRLREQVKRNKDRFPSKFMFRLTDEEVESMVSQNAIPSKQMLGGSLPLVFTEHGVLMLASVLRSNLAIQMSIKIIDVFVRMREMLSSQYDFMQKLELMDHRIDEHDHELRVLFNYLKKLMEEKEQRVDQENRKQIGFKTKQEK